MASQKTNIKKKSTSNYTSRKESKRNYKENKNNFRMPWQVRWFKYLNWIAFVAGPIIMLLLTGEMQAQAEINQTNSSLWYIALYFTILGAVMSAWSGYWLWFIYHNPESEILSPSKRKMYFWLIFPSAIVANFLTALGFIMLYTKVREIDNSQKMREFYKGSSNNANIKSQNGDDEIIENTESIN